jgi:deoxyadenosine/deoxycytidine kinase
MAARFLALAGNIGVGKSSLAERLARAAGGKPAFEAVAENPYLADFYRDMRRWGFHSQIFFLTRRIAQHHELLGSSGTVVQDRTLYEDAEIFARNLHLSGQLDERDWNVYYGLYAAVRDALRPPDCVVYLKASLPTLKERIKKRGRPYEMAIADDYLAALNALYDDWAAGYRGGLVVTLATDGLDFVGRESDLDRVLGELRQRGVY